MDTTLEYMTVEEATSKWKVRTERIILTCEHGGIKGAAKLSNQWIIPKGIPRPTIKKIPPTPRKFFDGKGSRTHKQQAFIDTFRDDIVPLHVDEYRIGNTVFTVTSCSSKKQKRTAVGAVYSLALRGLEMQEGIHISVAEREELLNELRQKEIEKQISFSEYMDYLKAALIKMDFCDDDIAMLLEKYAEAYRPLEEWQFHLTKNKQVQAKRSE